MLKEEVYAEDNFLDGSIFCGRKRLEYYYSTSAGYKAELQRTCPYWPEEPLVWVQNRWPARTNQGRPDDQSFCHVSDQNELNLIIPALLTSGL